MPKLIIRQSAVNSEVERGREFLMLTPEERLLHLVKLNNYAVLMKGGPLKAPQKKGLVIERRKYE